MSNPIESPVVRPYFEAGRLTSDEYIWILDALRHAAVNGLLPEHFPDAFASVSADDSPDLKREISAAWCLRAIACSAIESLDHLAPEALQRIAESSSAWPVILRPKLPTSADRARRRVDGLNLGAKLPIDLNHSVATQSGNRVPVHESDWPGIGLALRLYEELSAKREESGAADTAAAAVDPLIVMSAKPEDLADALETFWSDTDRAASPHSADPGKAAENACRKPTARGSDASQPINLGKDIHFHFLLATLPALKAETAEHWALASFRFLECENRGALAHDIGPESADAYYDEGLSRRIPLNYWSNVKRSAANRGRNAIRTLESDVLAALQTGFLALVKDGAE